MDNTIDAKQIDQNFAHIQQLADHFSSQIRALEETDLGPLLWGKQDGTSTYIHEQWMNLRTSMNGVWFFRLAIAWESFPEHRASALSSCREQIQDVTANIPEIMREQPSIIALLLPHFTEACGLLSKEKEISTESFIKGVTALAMLVGIVLGEQEEDVSPGQQWWGRQDAETGMCKRLYALLVPQNQKV